MGAEPFSTILTINCSLFSLCWSLVLLCRICIQTSAQYFVIWGGFWSISSNAQSLTVPLTDKVVIIPATSCKLKLFAIVGIFVVKVASSVTLAVSDFLWQTASTLGEE